LKKNIQYKKLILLLLLLSMNITACSQEEADSQEEVKRLKSRMFLSAAAETLVSVQIPLAPAKHRILFESLSGIPENPPVFLGTWKATRYVDGFFRRHGTQMMMESVEHLIGKEFYFGEDQIIVDGVICDTKPEYEISVHPISVLYKFIADGWSFVEESGMEFFGDNSTYFTFVAILPHNWDLFPSSINLFIKDQDTMIAQMYVGAVELKRVGTLPGKKLSGTYRDSVFLGGYGGVEPDADEKLVYAGQWEICDMLYSFDEKGASEIMGKQIIFSDLYIETDYGCYIREDLPEKGRYASKLYEVNICPDTERGRYDRKDSRLKALLWDGDKDYFVVVKMVDVLIKRDKLLGELLVKDNQTMYLYNRYGLFELRKTGEIADGSPFLP